MDMSKAVEYSAPVKLSGVVIGVLVLAVVFAILSMSVVGIQSMELSAVATGWIGLAGLLGLMMVGVPVGVALGVTAIVGIYIVIGSPTVVWSLLSTVPYEFSAHWTLSSVPMFLLMGYVLFHANLTEGLFRAARLWLSALPGGMAVASIGGCAGFSAVTGSSLACATAMGRIAVPEMLKLGYDRGLATGVAAAGGTIGVMIPPSLLLLIYGIYAEVPIGQLFIAGVLPGLLTALMYALMVMARAAANPSIAPRQVEEITWGDRFSATLETWPVFLLVFLVVGGLLAGVFTPTEGGAVGAMAAMVIARLKGGLDLTALVNAIKETMTSTASIFVIVIGASLFTRFLALTGLPESIADYFVDADASTVQILIGIAIVYLVLGMFLDNIGILLVTLPIFLPIVDAADISLIWFGILLCKLLEIALISPPVGLNCFAIKAVVGDKVSTGVIFKGIAWFVAADIVTMSLLVIFPEISLYLPSLVE